MAGRVLRGGLLAVGLAGTIVLAKPLGQLSPPPQPPVPPASSIPVTTSSGVALRPTQHPPVAREASSLWLAPSDADRAAAASNAALRNLQEGLKLYAQQKYDQAAVRFSAAAAPKSPLRDYGSYYAAVSELRQQRFDSARRHFLELKDANGYIRQAAMLGEAEADDGLKDYGAEVKVYERLLKGK